jgi:glucose/mannose-6-phosphate isomerase
VAYRWKTQVNENAKLPAFSTQLPEASHNELAGMTSEQAAPFSVVLLDDPDAHPRERRRIELTAELYEPSAESVVRIEAHGASRTARVLELVMLGDLVSLELAARRGVEPVPIAAIEELKRRLGEQ